MLNRSWLLVFAGLAIAAVAGQPAPRKAISPPTPVVGKPTKTTQQDWPVYNGQLTGDHFSPLTQINRKTVNALKVAWTFDTQEKGGLQTNPLIIGDKLFAYTPTQEVIALNAATGKPLWRFFSGKPGLQPARGFSYWTDGKKSVLFAAALDRLYALDPATGKAIPQFGEGGFIDLRKGLSDDGSNKGFVALTTPGVIYKDMIMVGFRAPETEPAPRGDIRAYDVHTGVLRWTFHTVPRPGEFGYETWPKDAWKITGAANNWTGMAVDEKRGIVYAPTGSAVNDFYGDDRLGDDLFADTLLALDANTGKRIWHFQGVHHDIWDRDFPSPPVLVTVNSGGKRVDAVVQATKEGVLFLFDRATGKPLFPIEERPFPASTVPGEKTSPTQPVPLLPAPYARQLLTEDMLTTRTPEAHADAIAKFRTFRSEGQFVPLSVDKPTVIFPGFDGGAEWGGSAVDPATGVVYINANDVPWTSSLTANTSNSPGAGTYNSQCAGCHGFDRKGSPPVFPSLTGESARLSDQAIADIVHGGKGRMPAFPNIAGDGLAQLLAYIKIGPTAKDSAAPHPVSLKSGHRSEAVGAAIYDAHCAICHTEDLSGNAFSNMPALIGVRARLSDQQILERVHEGKGRMPAFHQLSDDDTAHLLRFLGAPMDLAKSDKTEMESGEAGARKPYVFTGYHRFVDPDGYPAVVPPWGTLNAIDLNTGKFLWKIPLGEYPELAAAGYGNTGTENYGGPIVTAGGLVIIGATNFDNKIRAFDSSNGHLLWQADLPYAGNATPATYMINGKQYIVIATSSARNPKAKQGAAYVAFVLP